MNTQAHELPELRALIVAGTRLANIAYDQARQPNPKFKFAECYKAWNAALTSLRAALKASPVQDAEAIARYAYDHAGWDWEAVRIGVGERFASPVQADAVGDWVMVPREPTEEMLEAAMQREDDEPLSDWGLVRAAPHEGIYAAMLAAAPQPPAASVEWLKAMLHEGVPRKIADAVVRLMGEG